MLKNLKSNFKPIAYLTLIMSYPLFVIIILGWFLMPYTIGYLKEVLAFGFLTVVLLGVDLLTSNTKIRKWFTIISLMFLSFLAFLKLSFYSHYGVKLSASALFVIFETNGLETSDFLDSYFDYKVYGILVLLIVLFIVSIVILIKIKSYNIFIVNNIKLLSFVGISLSMLFIYNRFPEENIFIKSIKSYAEYREAKTILKESLAQGTNKDINVISSSNDPQTYVIVIGESTSRWHMQLYGYERETNPLLSKIRDELLIFDDVITPNVHTIVALEKILTLSNFKEKKKSNNCSVVQLANEAGFSTYWISNQKPVGIHESIPTIIGSAAKHKYFLATDSYAYDIYDENILSSLEIALNDNNHKKVIFIHLIGSHSNYKRRYPEEYNKFTGKIKNFRNIDKKSIKLINEYDNSIRYNDYVVWQIIEKVKDKHTKSYVAYFSDHGDDVFDTKDVFLGHNEYHATSPMYEVPLMFWFSESYKLDNPIFFNIKNITKRKYSLEHFIHSFSDLSNIKFDDFEKEKSIFNPEFKYAKRLIKNGIDYDNEK